MGISGLLPFLEKASKRCHVAEFRGCTVAIDTYCWLHKGAFGCAEKLVRGEDTNGYVLYCLKYIKMLQSYGIRPILVFDGQHLPAKRLTEEKRREQRRLSRKKATELLRIGKIEEAKVQMKSCVDITHKMALALIKECREKGVDCIVAPYEADAQLAYLNVKKFAHFIITEDSDLLLFGCNKIFFKMDLQGFGTLVEADKINLCMKLKPDNYNFKKFRYMCILSGCDYLESLPGVGIKKALKFISLTADPSIYNVLPKLPSYLRLPNAIVTDEYREGFMIADATFQHQLVFDPVERKLVPLQDPNSTGTDEDYCRNAGTLFDNRLAFQIALGNVDPLTHEQYDNWSPDEVSLPPTSIWCRQYTKPKEPVKKQPKLSAPITKHIQIDVQVLEQEKLEYDLKLEKELEVYKAMDHLPKRQKSNEKPEEVSNAPLVQEVNMPFKKLKKLSKFERTVVNYDEVLTSKFFVTKQVQATTSNYDSLLSGISDYSNAKKRSRLSRDREDEIIEESPVKIESEEQTRKLTQFDKPKKKLLSKLNNEGATTMEDESGKKASKTESGETENNKNIINLTEEDADDENIGSSITETFKETQKTSLKCSESESLEAVAKDIAESLHVDEQKESQMTDAIGVGKPVVNKKSTSPIITNRKGQCYKKPAWTSRKKKLPQKNQMNLVTMFSNMKNN